MKTKAPESKAQFFVWPATVLVVTSLLWVLASQVPLLPKRGGHVFLGPDGLLGFLEDRTIDARLAIRGSLPSPVPVIYVNVDTEALEGLGNFPWNRAVFAEALDALFEHGKIKAAGMDFVFSAAGIPQLGREEAEAGSAALGEAVRRDRNVVLAAAYGAEARSSVNLGSFPYVFEPGKGGAGLPELPSFPIVGPTWGHVGLINTVGEGARFVPFFARADSHTYYPLSLQLALICWGLDESAIQIGRETMWVGKTGETPKAHIPLILGQLVEPNWFSSWTSGEDPKVSIYKVLAAGQMMREGTDSEKADAATFFEGFRDSVVLIGPTDPLLKDLSLLPMDGAAPVPRVSIHGNLLKTLLSGRFIERPPVWVNVLIIMGLGWISGMFCLVPQKYGRAAKLVPVVVVAVYLGAAVVLFSWHNILVPVVAPLGASLSCLFVATVLQLSREQQQKRRIQELFGSYVSSAVVDEMVEKNIPPQTGGSEVEITAFFSDIVSFSPIAEELPPTDLVELMSEYLGEGTAAVMEASGTLDKYVGDAIVSIFGAPLPCPNHAAAACQAALGLQAGQVRLRVRWGEQGGRWPKRVHEMSTRVGLHTGMAIVGNIGSKLRFNYTMMGDTVNLAQRIEAAGSYFGSGILVSGETYAAALRDDPDLVFRPLDRVRVSGRNQPVDLYELLGRGPEAAEASARRIAAYAAARDLYRSGRWSEAREAFLEAAKFEAPGSGKNPSLAMANRCSQLADRPPEADYVFFISK